MESKLLKIRQQLGSGNLKIAFSAQFDDPKTNFISIYKTNIFSIYI